MLPKNEIVLVDLQTIILLQHSVLRFAQLMQLLVMYILVR